MIVSEVINFSKNHGDMAMFVGLPVDSYCDRYAGISDVQRILGVLDRGALEGLVATTTPH